MTIFKSNGEDSKKLILRGMLNALATSLYIIAIVTFINNAQKIFGNGDDKFFIPVIMLTLFVLSALITSLLILGKPLMLYFDGQKKDSVKLLLSTVISLAAILVLVLLSYLGLR